MAAGNFFALLTTLVIYAVIAIPLLPVVALAAFLSWRCILLLVIRLERAQERRDAAAASLQRR